MQEDLLVVLDPRIRTHGSNLCSLIVAGNRYLFISPLRGSKQRECFLEGILWTLSGENEYDDVCLRTRQNNYKEEEEAEAEAKENGGGVVILIVIKCSCWWRFVWLQYWMMIPGQEQHEADMHV